MLGDGKGKGDRRGCVDVDMYIIMYILLYFKSYLGKIRPHPIPLSLHGCFILDVTFGVPFAVVDTCNVVGATGWDFRGGGGGGQAVGKAVGRVRTQYLVVVMVVEVVVETTEVLVAGARVMVSVSVSVPETEKGGLIWWWGTSLGAGEEGMGTYQCRRLWLVGLEGSWLWWWRMRCWLMSPCRRCRSRSR